MNRHAVVILFFAFAASGRVIPFLSADSGSDALVAPAEALGLLRNFTGPVAIVTFIGRARSGKSFGLNHLLKIPHEDGFRVGHTYAPQTKGAQIWSEPFPGTGPSSRRPTVLVIDTEGLGSGDLLYDRVLLATTSVISSRLVYHGVYTFDTEDILRLHGLKVLVEDFANRGLPTNAHCPLPRITWVLNRSVLKKTRAGQTDLACVFDGPLAEKPNPHANNQTAEFNLTARIVKNAFPSHAAHLIPSAAPPEISDVSELTNVNPEMLSEAYRCTMDELRMEIAREVPRYAFGTTSTEMTGPEIATLLESVLPAANEGMERVVDRISEALARRHIAQAKSNLEGAINQIKYPMDDTSLEDLVADLVEDVRNALYARTQRSSSLGTLIASFEHELGDKFAAEKLRAKKLNVDASDELCKDVAARAAMAFSLDRLTKNGTADFTMDAFDVAVENALAKYDRGAVGPGTKFYRAELEAIAAKSREAALEALAPLRLRVWLADSVLVFTVALVLTFPVRAAKGLVPGAITAILGTFVFGTMCVSAVLAILAALAMAGMSEPLVTLANFGSSVYRWSYGFGKTMLVANAILCLLGGTCFASKMLKR